MTEDENDVDFIYTDASPTVDGVKQKAKTHVPSSLYRTRRVSVISHRLSRRIRHDLV